MEGKTILTLLTLIWLTLSQQAHAAVIELTGMLDLNKSAFSDGYESRTRRYSGQIDFKFTSVSSIQFEYTDSLTRVSYLTDIGTLLPKYTRQIIFYRDKVHSFNWVQNLVPSKWILQPYIVFGGGKMTRKYREEYPEFGLAREVIQTVTTGTGGAGVRLFLTKNMALKYEFKTYVPKFRFKQWREMQNTSIGISWLF